MNKEEDKLRAENERLRGLLKKVCDYAEEISCDDGATFRITKEAREALKEGK